MQVVQPNVVMAPQQRSGLDSFLARLMALGQLGLGAWQGIQSQEQLADQKMQIQTQRMQSVVPLLQYAMATGKSPQEVDAMLALGGVPPELRAQVSNLPRFQASAVDLNRLINQTQQPQRQDIFPVGTSRPDWLQPNVATAPSAWGVR